MDPLLIIFLTISSTLAIDTFKNRIATTPLFLYTFEEGQYGASATSADLSGNGYTLHINSQETYFNNQSVGLSWASATANGWRARSNQNMTQIVSRVAGNSPQGYTIELWLGMSSSYESPGAQTGDVMGIVSDWRAYVQNTSPFSPSLCSGALYLLTPTYDSGYTAPAMQYTPLTNVQTQGAPTTCNPQISMYAGSTSVADLSLFHAVFTFGQNSNPAQSTVNEYANGMQIQSSPTLKISGVNATWLNTTNITQFRIRVGDTANVYPQLSAFIGNVFAAAMYDRALTLAEVQQNFAAGLPNSRPYVLPSHQPAVEETVSVVTLTGHDFDVADAGSLVFYIDVLPARGTLFLGNTMLTSSTVLPIEVPLSNTTSPTAAVYYQGGPLGFGVAYDNFQFSVSDGNKTSAPGYLYLDLSRINHPPVASSYVGPSVVRFSTVAVNLTATDVDVGDGLSAVFVTSLPTYSNLSFVGDYTFFNASELPLSIPSDGSGNFVVWFHTGLGPNSNVGSGIAIAYVDGFNFSVVDNSPYPIAELPSLNTGRVTMNVYNELSATPARFVTLENSPPTSFSPLSITLNGTSQVGNPFVGVIEILPTMAKTFTLDMGGKVPITAGMAIPYSVVYYTPNEYYNGLGLDSFTFKIHDVVTGRESAPATITIDVTPVNSLQSITFTCGGDASCPLTVGQLQDWVNMENFMVTDPDVSFGAANSSSQCYLVTIDANYGAPPGTLYNRISLGNFADSSTAKPILSTGQYNNYFEGYLTLEVLQMYLQPLQFQTQNSQHGKMMVQITMTDPNSTDSYTHPNTGFIAYSCVLPPLNGPLFSVSLIVAIENAVTQPKAQGVAVKLGLYVTLGTVFVSLSIACLLCIYVRKKKRAREIRDKAKRFHRPLETIVKVKNKDALPLHQLEEMLWDGKGELIATLCVLEPQSEDTSRALLYLTAFHLENNHPLRRHQLLERVCFHEIERVSQPKELVYGFAGTMFEVYGLMVGMNFLFQTIAKDPVEKITMNSEALPTSHDKYRDNKHIYDADLSLTVTCSSIVQNIYRSAHRVPQQLSEVLKFVQEHAEKKWPGKGLVTASSLFFTRYICVALNQPEKYWLSKQVLPKPCRLYLFFVAKILEHISDGQTYAVKDDYSKYVKDKMEANNFIMNNNALALETTQRIITAKGDEVKNDVPKNAEIDSLVHIWYRLDRDRARIPQCAPK